MIGCLSAAAEAFVFRGIAPDSSSRIRPESMLWHAENKRTQLPIVISVLGRMPAKPVLSNISTNTFPGDEPLSAIWAMKASNERKRSFGICKSKRAIHEPKKHTSRRSSMSFFTLFPLAAGLVVIGRLSAAAKAFIFDGIARDVGFFCFFLGKLARPAKIPFTPRVITQPKMGRLSKTGRRLKGNHLSYKTPTVTINNRTA
jgi:hypothetical protein